MKTLVLAGVVALCLVSIDGRSRFVRSASAGDKIHHKYRPVKESALFEKPAEEVPTDEEGVDSESGNDGSPFDWNELLNTGRRGRTTNVRQLFSKLWKDLFGNQNVTIPTVDADLDSPDEESFFRGIFDLTKPWWKGANVCTREEESEEEARGTGDFLSSLLTSCEDVGSAYKCSMKVGKDGKIKTRTLIYECCHGWTRSSGSKGCTERLVLTDMISSLTEMNLTRFLNTLETTGLSDRFSQGNYSVFVPTNEALSRVTDSEEISFVLLDTENKMEFVEEIMLGHMVPGWEYSYQWTDEMLLQTAKDDYSIRINFYTYPRPFATANCGRILSTNRKSLGGLIHTVDRVIMPARQSLWEVIGQDSRFRTFSSLVPDELQVKLSDPSQHLTVLAFTDEEFDKLPTQLKSRIRAKEDCFSDVASQMIIPHTICSEAIQSEAVVRNLAGKLINASVSEEGESDGVVSFGGVPIIAPDRIATNGIIHVMGGVIMLEHMQSALELAEKKNGEVFASLLESNGLSQNLPSPVTLFVPPNEKLMEAELGETDEEQENTLKNHIVDNLVSISPRNPEQIVETKAGKELSIKVQRSPFFLFEGGRSFKSTIGCARIIRPNIHSCDGVLHFVDRVLRIPNKSMMDILREKEDVSEFVSLLEMAGVDSEVGAEGFHGTILAPTDNAFQEHLSAEQKENLLKEPEKLARLLKQHILNESVCCHELGSPLWFQPKRYETLAGNYLVSSGYGGRKRIGGAFVEECDREATNGIIHTVDRPIMRRRANSIFDLFSNGRRDFNWNIDWPF